MSSVKECFSKGIGYIKMEIDIFEDERNELTEYLGHHKNVPLTPTLRARLNKEKNRLDVVERKLTHL